jgi:hypothetical protein
MKTVFLLQHSYDVGENDEYEETKIIGVYTSQAEADQAIHRLKDKPGFRYKPEAFGVIALELNKDQFWAEGYASLTGIRVKDKAGEWTTVQAECLPNNTYQILEYYRNESLGEFQNLDIVEGEQREDGLYAIRLIHKNGQP